METTAAADVIIIGLGPVGSILTGLLGLRGLSVVALERDDDVFPLPRAAHIDHTALRTLQELGCLDELLPTMLENPGLDFVGVRGEVLSSIPGNQGSVSGLPASMYFHQPYFDRKLREVASGHSSVSVHTGVGVVNVVQRSSGVHVYSVDRAGQRTEYVGRYAVACDGAKSFVRELIDVPLVDLGFHEDWVVVDVRLHEPFPALPDRAVNFCNTSRPMGIVPMPGNRYRFELMILPGEEPASMSSDEVIVHLLRPWLRSDSTLVEYERKATYTFHGLIARSWRSGSVFLAGDAAHQMPPFLGQGMNSGIRDAANLAWKLSCAVRDDSLRPVLDTYESERSPHVTSIIRRSVDIGKIVCELDPDRAAERDRVYLGDPEIAQRDLFFSLPPLERGALVSELGGVYFPQPTSSDGAHRFDDIWGTNFLALARSVADLQVPSATDWRGVVAGTPAEFPGFEESLVDVLDDYSANVVLVRPDRYVLDMGRSLEEILGRNGPLLADLLLRGNV